MMNYFILFIVIAIARTKFESRSTTPDPVTSSITDEKEMMTSTKSTALSLSNVFFQIIQMNQIYHLIQLN